MIVITALPLLTITDKEMINDEMMELLNNRQTTHCTIKKLKKKSTAKLNANCNNGQ